MIGEENFEIVRTYLQDQRRQQSHDATRTDDIILSGLQTICPNSAACNLIDDFVLHECLNEFNERSETS